MCYHVRNKLVKTRKAGTCFGCCNAYAVGTPMHAYTMRGDGSIYTLHICHECDQVASTWRSGEMWYEGDLADDSTIMSLCDRLTPAPEGE